jgi:hypothetical protein
VAAQGRPARFPGESVEQHVAALVQTGNQLRVGDVFGSEVEGVQLAGGGARPDGEILRVPPVYSCPDSWPVTTLCQVSAVTPCAMCTVVA